MDDVDIEFEKIIFLCCAEEGNEGLFDLINELSYYNISNEEKLTTAKKLLISLAQEELIIVERFERITDKQSVEIISGIKLEEVLNNPLSWMFSSINILSMTLTDKGMTYLDANYDKYRLQVQKRWFGRDNPNIARVTAKP